MSSDSTSIVMRTEKWFNETVQEPLGSVEEATLAQLITKGDNDARRRMAEANLGLVRQKSSKFVTCSFYDDLVGAGNLALAKSLDGYNLSAGNRFSALAGTSVAREISVATIHEDKHGIKIPNVTISYMIKLRQYRRKHGLADDAEIESVPKLTKSQLALAIEAEAVVVRNGSFRRDKGGGCVSDATFEDFIEQIPDPDTGILDKIISEERTYYSPGSLVSRAVQRLRNPRDRFVIRKRFGLRCDPMELDEVGRLFEPKLTKEAIRQIEARALIRLRETIMRMVHRGYLDLPARELRLLHLALGDPKSVEPGHSYRAGCRSRRKSTDGFALMEAAG